ncbi:helix-turn-helix domain-containing protein [Halobacillus sp. BBL2006]|uniref:helix-turn-helix domain-containing protein n=1 Tax=Halobacillus sp. BBL2006 TaxID=1543706 RepID=UPI000543AB2D|nr:helix-turn-helix transcriptional regulator [Halobacillus sp. BBL2006]KHE69240.1 transcriptional regulator [Halobacillus sp. BBL2006]
MIGTNIHYIRKRRGLSLSDLAERAGISKSYLSNIERNLNQNPSVHLMDNIAKVLRVDLLVLINKELPKNTPQPLEDEWITFINDLKQSGIEKEQLQEYKKLIAFIQWENTTGKEN